MTSLSKQRPVQEFRGLGNLKVAVWKREYEGRTFYTYGPERGYKDKHGNWKSTSSFSPAEWEAVNSLLERAKAYVATAMQTDAARQAAAEGAETPDEQAE
jgi:hypothetical protein